jgi:hypothetical protein
MPEYVRVADFEADEAALDAMVSGINEESGPPEGVPAKSVTVLADRSAGKVRIVVRFGSEEDLRTGSAALEAMSPPPGANVRRVAVEEFEVVLKRETP